MNHPLENNIYTGPENKVGKTEPRKRLQGNGNKTCVITNDMARKSAFRRRETDLQGCLVKYQ